MVMDIHAVLVYTITDILRMSKASESHMVSEVLPGAGEANLSEDEVRRRLPEVELIDDPHLRHMVIEALQYTPDYWWEVAASVSGNYHNEFARGEHGLWIHTKMAVTVYDRLIDSWVYQGILSEYHADCVLAGILLHDMFKQGLPEDRDPDDYTTEDDHDVTAARWLRKHTELPYEVIHAVDAHNGPWYEGAEPKESGGNIVASSVAQMTHICDMVASDSDMTMGIWKPTEEILDVYPDIPTSNLG